MDQPYIIINWFDCHKGTECSGHIKHTKHKIATADGTGKTQNFNSCLKIA